MLEECANVVNDRSFSPNDSPEWAPYYQGAFSRLRSTADGASRRVKPKQQPAFGYWRQTNVRLGLHSGGTGWNGLRSCRHEL
jgi:hypothetical protein